MKTLSRCLGLAALLLGISVSAQADDWSASGAPVGKCTTCGGSIAEGIHAHGRHIVRSYNEWVVGRKFVYFYNLPNKHGQITDPAPVLTGPAFDPQYKTPKMINPGYPVNQTFGGGYPIGQPVGGTIVGDPLPPALGTPTGQIIP